jgi:tetratricopeptide (TPR) repeat protein
MQIAGKTGSLGAHGRRSVGWIRKRALLMMVCVGWAMNGVAAEAAEQALHTALYMNLASFEAVPLLAGDQWKGLLSGEEGGRLSRLLFPLFAGGRCCVPVEPIPFPPAGGELLAAVRPPGIPLYGVFDCLHWTLPGTPPEADLFRDHPDWQELNASYSCNAAADGKYASPFHSEVRAALGQLVEAVAQALPDLEGIVLDCHLSLQDYLTYSEAARVAFIRAHQIDPLDISLAPHDEASYQALHTLERWRLDQVTKLVGALSAAFRRHNPEGKVVGRGFANLYRWRGGKKNWLAQDWLNWAVEGHVDELLLECDWAAPENAESFVLAADLVRRAGVNVGVTPLLYAPSRPGGAGYEAQLAALQKQARIDRVVLEVRTPEDLRAAWGFLAAKHPITEPPPSTGAGLLADDRRLQRRVTWAEPGTAVGALLTRLSAELDVPLRAAGSVQEVAVTLTVTAQPAAAVLADLAATLPGAWRVEGEGYVLDELPAPERLEGDRLRQAREFEAAVRSYQAAIEKGADVAQAWFGLGQVYLQQNDPSSALNAFEQALEADPENRLVEVEMGHCYRYLGALNEAVVHYERFLEKFPSDYWGLLGLGQVHLSAGRLDAARSTFEKLVQAHGNDARGHFLLGRTLQQQGDLEAARKELRQAVTLDEHQGEAWFALGQVELGRVYRGQGQLADVVRTFEKALAEQPDNALIHCELGHCYRQMGEVKQALAHYQKFLEVHPNDFWGLLGMGATYLLEKQIDRAWPYLQKAVERAPTEAWGHYFLGEAYRQKGDLEQAVKSLEKAVELDPQNGMAKELLDKVKQEAGAG